MYEELVKSLRWLGFMFPETHPSRDDADRISNNIHLDCTQAADAIEELQAQLMFSNDAAKAIAEKVPKWIPVTERLPENKVPVQVVYLGVNDGKQYSDLIACVFEGMWCYWDGEPCSYDECKCEITHWQPLPEPPKEEI